MISLFARRLIPSIMAILLFLVLQPGLSSGQEADGKPWEKFGANIGAFISATDSSVVIGSGIGLEMDVEELLGLDSSTSVFRTDAWWRFSDNRRHRVDLTYFALRRDASKQLTQDITFENDNGELINIDSGATVETSFDFDIWELAYYYSFFQDDRIDLAAGVGLYLMPIDFSLRVTGAAEENASADFTAPLPVFGLRMDVALTPQWFIRTGSQIFYMEYENFKGSILESRIALEYNPWKHVGFGLGFDTLVVKLEAEDEDWPGVDFTGTVDFKYTGLQLYLRLFF